MRKWVYLGMGIAIGASATAMSGRARTQDPVRVSPGYYTVRFENDRVRVLEYRLPPGRKEALHAHPARVVYELTDSTIRMAGPDGRTTESTGKAGDLFWGEPMTHALENVGSTEVHAIAVELKPCGS